MSNNKYDEDDPNELKLIMVGESGAGKTNLITVSTGGEFDAKFESTSAPSFVQKILDINNEKYTVYLWDTLGNEKFRSLTKIFMKCSKIVIFVYDVTDKHSFTELPFWVSKVEEVLGKNPVIGVCGNKVDLVSKEEVTDEEGRNYAKSIGAKFKLTSAKEDPEGISDFIQELVVDYIMKYDIKPIPNKVKENSKTNRNSNSNSNKLDIKKAKKKKKKDKCC